MVPSGSLETAMRYYHYQNCPTADMPMNIFLAKNVKNKPSLDSCDTALCIWKYIRDWNSSIPNPVDTAPNFLVCYIVHISLHKHEDYQRVLQFIVNYS